MTQIGISAAELEKRIEAAKERGKKLREREKAEQAKRVGWAARWTQARQKRRERVLTLMAEGKYTRAEIAKEVGCCTSTVGMILRAAHAINPREPKRMPPETRAKVMTMLEEGRKVKEISEMLGIAYQTIYSCATRGGYKDSVAHTRHAPEVKAQAIALCRELHSVTKAARAMGLSKYTVYDWVRYSDEEFV